MHECREAVPVWIMPLSRVADSFSASSRFDVVIIDEASQSDVMALVALYMGDGAIIVGDNEQVSPEAVGQDLDEVQRLIDEHLADIPNGHLYDGKTSIYDLARQSFGGAIRLREHFRCLPEIIQFSNDLSYDGDIQPLRDDSGVRRRPPVVTVHVGDAVSRNKRNRREAEFVTSLVAAALDEPEYADASVGVISMVGEDQAYDIATELSRHLTPATLERHKVMCGNPAQFQGDERDVIFISMVDAPEGGILPMRSDDRFKKRFNVAASRARDQIWVVHSLSHDTDLKVGDLRRSLIEHAIDPGSKLAEWRRLRTRADRRSGEFEEHVLKELRHRQYSVMPQYRVGAYVLDFVVEGDGRRVALECDGDRYHTLENLQEDMARQAVLERRGWRFVRIRGTEFFRRPAETMNSVCEKLERLGVRPSPQGAGQSTAPTARARAALIERVTFRAEQLRHAWYGMSGIVEGANEYAIR
jgi:very-short-patch-repair endonuclease